MVVSSNFSIAIFDNDRISDVNNVVVKYADFLRRSSSHMLFNIEPVNLNEVYEDLSFFTLSSDNENSLNDKLNELIESLDTLDTNYNLRNEDTKEMIVNIHSLVGLDILFKNINMIPEGTYKKIDDLKNKNFKFGYTKGYKPTFRPLESKLIEGVDIQNEIIYLFADSSENMSKLKEELSEKVMEINPDFIIEFRYFEGQ